MRAAVLLTLLFAAGCNKDASPSAPTRPVPPPPAAAPTISCPGPITVAAATSGGARVTYPAPQTQGGEGALRVNCTPPSDEVFAVGTTQVECTVTDSLNRTASCSFAAIVSAPPRLRLTRFMAFGDSITEGQLVVPGTDNGELIARPEVSYPTVLSQLLSARYTDQSMVVFNRGLGGERAERATSRFITQFRADAPTAVVLMEGYNDIIQGESGLGIIAGAAGVRELAMTGRSFGARVFICTLAPSRPGRKQIPMSAIREINDRLRDVARAEGAYLIDIFAALLPDVDAMVSGDGLHLTVAGNRRVAETVFAALRDDLEIK